MTQLSAFSAEEVETIVSLPYRVGIHVSYADDEDGEQDDELETRALEACLKEVVKTHEAVPLSQEIAQEVLDSKDKWDNWTQGVFNIEPQCEKAVALLKSQASESEVKDYIKMTLEVASAVAQAYGEFGEEQEPEKGFFGNVMGKIMGGFSTMGEDDTGHPMNVSPAEDSAISRISKALKKNA